MNNIKELNKFISKNNKYTDYYSKFGYKCFGPMLFSFSKWLYNNCIDKKINKIYFLARDGYIFKQAFDLFNFKDIKTEYFYASRRSIIVPSLCMIDNPLKIFDVITFSDSTKLKSLIKKVGLEDYDLNDIINKYNLDLDTEYKIEYLKNDCIDFLNEIFPIIIDNSKKELNNFNKYIESVSFNGNVAIVDIGWFGTMQLALQKIVNNTNIYGFYFGVYPYKEYGDTNISGFVFDHKNNNKVYEEFRNFIQVFEFMTLASHGSVKKFNEDLTVDFYDYEYENCIEKEIVNKIQKSATKFVEDYIVMNKDIDMYTSIYNFKKVCMKPCINDAKNIGKINFMDDEIKKLVPYKNSFYYLIHPKKIYKDLNNSVWKIGFLKRFFKLKLPYNFMVNKLRKLKERGK